MPHPDGFNSEDTIVKYILPEPNIHPGLIRTAMSTLLSIISLIKLTLTHQATPTPVQPHSSGFDHQGSGLESSDADCNSSTNNSANHPQHPPSIIEFNKSKSDLEEQHGIDRECIKQNLTMQHNRDLQIVKDESHRINHGAMMQIKDSEQQALAQSGKIDVLQSQINQLSQLVKQQQQTSSNIATPQHNIAQQHSFSLYHPYTHSHSHSHTQDPFNLSLNNILIGVWTNKKSPRYHKNLYCKKV